MYEIYSKRKIGHNVLFNRLNNYYPNIKLTIELNPSKFLDTKLTSISMDLKKIVLVVYITLVNLSVIQKIIMKIIIQLKVQNHRNTFETISTSFIWTSISNSSKNAKTRKYLETSYGSSTEALS